MTTPSLPAALIENLVRTALAEDVGAGDITTECCVPADLQGRASIIAKEPCVVAGLPLVAAVFAELDARNENSTGWPMTASQWLKRGNPACTINGFAAHNSHRRTNRAEFSPTPERCIATLTAPRIQVRKPSAGTKGHQNSRHPQRRPRRCALCGKICRGRRWWNVNHRTGWGCTTRS